MELPKKNLDEDLRVLRISPERKARSKPRGVLLLAFIIPCLIVITVLAMRLDLRSPLGLGATSVRVVAAARKSNVGPQPLLTAGGYIIARNQVELGSKITGRIVSLEVQEGDLVQRGQITARLDDAESKASVAAAQASLEAARAHLADVIAGSRPQEISRASNEVERLDSDLNNAEIRLRRAEELARAGVISKQEVDDDQSRYQMALAARRGAKESLDLIRIGPRREQIALARAGVHKAESELALARALGENTIVRAPITGTILARYVSVGEMVTTGFTSERGAKQALLTIADLTDLQVELNISEADIARVQLKQPVTVTPDAYSNRLYKGIVEYISASADRQKATVQVKVKVSDPDGVLRPDMGAKVTFYALDASVPQQVTGVLIPKSAVVNQEGKAYVFLVKDEKALRQAVILGAEEESYVNIIDGLQGGERVILSGSVKEGEKVKVQP